MKLCQNKAHILRPVLSSLPNPGSAGSSGHFARQTSAKKALLSVLLASVWLGISLFPAAAQQGEPVNLLTIIPTTAKTEQTDTNNPLNIDQAIDRVVASDDKQQQAEPETGALRPTAPADTNGAAVEPLTLLPTEQADPSLADAPAQNGTQADGKTIDSPDNDASSGSSLLANDIYGSAKIGRRKISDVGLAAIGVGDTGNSQLDSLIWRGTSARDAVFLLQKAAVMGQSQAITDLAYEVVARQSVPPSGANNVAADLVEARLAFLANGGRSSDLAVLAAQLPEAEKWADWRRWLTEHYLMIRDDVAACEIVSRQITQTMDPFWHKSNVICQAVQGNIGGARFAADILSANGIEDPIFFGLVDEVLSNDPAQPVDPSKLDSAHIVLMDVANRPIPLEGLAVLPKQMAETVMKLKFLGPDARMVSTFDGLSRGLITHRQAGKLWRNAGQENDDPQLALARLDGRANALTTALAWRALDADTKVDRLALVAKAIKAEIMVGNGAMMLPLYAELVRNALADEAVAASMRFDDLDVAPKMAFMLAINQPNDTTTLAAFAGNGDALRVSELLRGLSDRSVDTAVISGLQLWHILPVLDAAGVAVEDQDWLDLVKGTPVSGQGFVGLSPLLLKAVTSAAESRHVAETVLLANWLLHDVALEKANPADLAAVIRALEMIGQREVAKAFAQEIIAAHLMQRLAAMVPDGTQS